jgi:mRNA-degrading endonuclease RelE of RelBE toxin-antitoxin system
MAPEPSTWTISYSNKAKKSALKLPVKVKVQLDLLAKEMETCGPYRENWTQYGPLGKGPGVPENAYHCHIKSGHPTYVVCWQVEDKKLRIVEIFYVSTHENTPY